MSSREVYEIAVTRPTGISVGDMQRYIAIAVAQSCKGAALDEPMRDINDDTVRVHRQAPDRKFWISADAQLPPMKKTVHIKYTNGITARAYLEATDRNEKVKWFEWIHAETGRKIPWNTVQAWMS